MRAGFFEVELLRRACHPFPEQLDELGALPLQEEKHLLAEFGVFFGGNQPAAGGRAFFDLVIQARPRPVAKAGVLAGAERKGIAEEPERLLDGGARGIGPEVAGPVPPHFPHQGELGEIFVDAEFEAEVGLVVLQVDVVAGLVLLDEGVFQDQGFFFRVREERLHLAHFGHEETKRGPPVPGFPEIGPDPVAEVLGLADVDDRPGRVFHQVHARA